MSVNEKDWKLFRKKLPEWQESYMEKLVEEYIDILNGDGLASDKYWALEKRVKSDKKNPGVLMTDISRSNFLGLFTSLIGYKVISLEDLDGFSEETKEAVKNIAGRWNN